MYLISGVVIVDVLQVSVVIEYVFTRDQQFGGLHMPKTNTHSVVIDPWLKSMRRHNACLQANQ